jgi:hypothetical protein
LLRSLMQKKKTLLVVLMSWERKKQTSSCTYVTVMMIDGLKCHSYQIRMPLKKILIK